MSKKTAQTESTEIAPRCDYCKHNGGENKKFGFMWNCRLLGYSVVFGYKRKHTTSGEFQYCKAMFLGQGSFELNKEKYKTYQLNNK